jgi:hypothetical protein
MRGCVTIVGIALVATAAAADPVKLATPTMFAVTATHQRHSGETAVAGGPSSWAVVWDDFPPNGPDSPVRTFRAAIVSPGGKVALAPKPLWAATTSSPEVFAAWNGKSFTVVVCSDYWNGGDETMLWGELATDGTFTPRGQKAFTGPFYCADAVPVGDRLDVIVVDHDTQYGAGERVVHESCATQRVEIAGDKVTMFPAAPICDVMGADATSIAGRGLPPKNTFAIADNAGDVWKPKLPYPPDAVIATDAGLALTAPDKAYKTEQWIAVDAKKKKLAKPVALEIDKKDVGGNGEGFVLPGGAFALFASVPPPGEGLTAYGADGKVRWTVAFGEQTMTGRECAPSAGSLLCTWTDDDEKTNQGEVRAVEIKVP